MRLDLDAKVRARDGEEIGSVDRAIVNPQTNEVTDIVVRTGAIFGRDIVVPREDVERANQDGDTIQLDVTKAELEQFPDFVIEQYGAPPPTWVAPAGYGFPAGSYAWPIAVDPLGGPMPMTVPEELVDDADSDEPEHVTLTKGALVLDTHDDDIGVVEDLRFDVDTGQLQGFVLRVGGALRTLFGGGDTIEVSRHQIRTVGESVVTLRLAKEEVEAAAHAASDR